MAMYAEYFAIKAFYGDRIAKRSGFKLMRHIEEGLNILDSIGASSKAKKAFCIHPLVQNNEGPEVGASEAYDLACEYRDRANAYLCKPDTDKVNTVADVFKLVGPMSKDCRDMLVADKRQNFADFIIAHYRKHPRSKELFLYFQLWLAYLDSPIAVLRET